MYCCQKSEPYKISGQVKKGFEPVRDVFEGLFKSSLESNSQLCVYHNQQKIIDISGTTNQNKTHHYSSDSIQCIFSNSKTISAILIAIMVDQGHLSYTTPISTYWPLFASKDKSHLTTQHILQHQAGLWVFDQSISLEQMLTANIKQNSIGKIIEQQQFQTLPAGAQRTYHTLTKDWITNEIFRRVEPQHRTMAEYFRQEIQPLLKTDIFIDMKDNEFDRCADVKVYSKLKSLYHMTKKTHQGRVASFTTGQLRRQLSTLKARQKTQKSHITNPKIINKEVSHGNQKNIFKLINHPLFRSSEMPSASIHASASGMAKLAALMANHGTLNNTTLLSPTTHSLFHSNPNIQSESPFGIRTAFTTGGVSQFGLSNVQSVSISPQLEVPECTQDIESQLHANRSGWFGWMGMGGAIMQWNIEYNVGFAYAGTDLYLADLVNRRVSVMQQVVIQMIDKINSQQNLQDQS